MPAGSHRWVAGILVALSFAVAGKAALAGTISGNVRIGVNGVSLADAGAIVVYLVANHPTIEKPSSALPRAEVHQRGARFEPDFLVVTVGQTVAMPNDDVIFHNVFSYSEPNDFDLGLYGAGQSPTLRFTQAGLVKIYCSIHEEMDGLIFVAPSRLHALPRVADGRFSIENVPPGRYEVHVWSERLPEQQWPLEIPSDAPVDVSLSLGQRSS